MNNLYLSSVILTDVGRTGILIEGTNNNIHISNTVSNGVDNEVIKITGTSNNGKIADTVINGDSAQGEAWIKIDGNNFQITGTVGTGAPKNGFLVREKICLPEIRNSFDTFADQWMRFFF